jgi:hypothetical protein
MSNDGWPASRAYTLGAVARWLLFLGGVALLAWADDRMPPAARVAVALVLAASVAWQFADAYRLIARQDEFIRGITAKRIIVAAGLTLTVAVLWGLLQQFVGGHDGPIWILYPLFWGVFGLVTPFIRDSRP